jgi:hypothetical protein
MPPDHRTQHVPAANLPRPPQLSARRLVSLDSYPLLQIKPLTFRFNCTIYILIPINSISYRFQFLLSPAYLHNQARYLLRRDPLRTDPSCLIAYRGSSHCDQSPVCAVALSGAGRYIARRYTAIVVTRSVTLLCNGQRTRCSRATAIARRHSLIRRAEFLGR